MAVWVDRRLTHCNTECRLSIDISLIELTAHHILSRVLCECIVIGLRNVRGLVGIGRVLVSVGHCVLRLVCVGGLVCSGLLVCIGRVLVGHLI